MGLGNFAVEHIPKQYDKEMMKSQKSSLIKLETSQPWRYPERLTGL